MTYDTIIIGKGPAGISAAIYIARAGFSVLVVGKTLGALEKAEIIENYYGFPDPVPGSEIVERGIAQAVRLGVQVVTGEVVSIGLEEEFLVKTVTEEYRSRTVVLATGKSRFALKVPGFEALRGKGISFCATCDGFFYRNKRLAMIGNGDYALSELHELTNFTKDITLFTNGAPPIQDLPEGCRTVTAKIKSFVGNEKLSAILTEDGVTHDIDGAFVALGTAGAADFAAKIGVEVNGQDIVVDGQFMTNIPGLYAAGDCVGGFLQIAKAVSDGAITAKNVIARLKK